MSRRQLWADGCGWTADVTDVAELLKLAIAGHDFEPLRRRQCRVEMLTTAELRLVAARNADMLRKRPLAEVSGALGDLGTLLPLMIALAVQGSIKLDATLVFSGFFNVVTGVIFGIPLPVQPMKVRGFPAPTMRRKQTSPTDRRLPRPSHRLPSRAGATDTWTRSSSPA
jgi:hypothetical protein